MIPVWVRTALWVVILALGAWFAVHIRGTLSIFALAFLIAYLLNPVVKALEVGGGRFLPPMSRTWAIVVVYMLLLGLMGAGLSLLVPVASEQAGYIAQHLPDQVSQVQQSATGLWHQYLQRVPLDVRTKVEAAAGNLLQQAAAGLQVAFEKLTGWVGGFFSLVFFVLTAMLISIYILVKWADFGPGALELVPVAYRDDAKDLSRQMNEIFGGYLRALIVTSVVCGVATFLTLVILSLVFQTSFPYTLIVSFLAGITYGIPILGILVSALLGALLAFITSGDWGFALAVCLSVTGVNTLIDRTLFPKLTGEAMGVSELFVLFGAFAGGELLGIWGMLLGIPGSAIAKALFTWFHDRFLVASDGEAAPSSGWQEAPPPAPAEAPKPEAAASPPPPPEEAGPEESSTPVPPAPPKPAENSGTAPGA